VVISRLLRKTFGQFSRWFVSLLSPDSALRLAQIALRQAHKFGLTFITLDMKTKFDGPFRYGLLDPVIPEPNKRIAVIIQGPLVADDEFTLETVRYYRRACPEFTLIVSTWEDENANRLAKCRDLGAEVILSPRPAVAGRYNVNLQSISTAAGIAHAIATGCRFIAKTRADQRLCAIHTIYGLPALLAAFPPLQGTGQVSRLISTSYGTYKYNPFHLSDFFMFGDSEDMAQYWSVAPDTCTLTRAELDAYLISCRKILDYYAYTPERYLITQFIAKQNENPMFTVAAWWQILAERLLILDWSQFDVYWPKYEPYTTRPDLQLNRVVATNQISFADWVRLATSNTSDWYPPEQVLELPPTTETSLRLADLVWKNKP
jgi:hypothetical protein